MAVSELAQYFFQVEQQIDPLDSYQLLSQFRPLLLEGNGLHPEARHSYLAISPKLTFTIAGGTARIEYDDGKTEERNGNPLQLLTEICQQYRFESPHPGFTGGFVGAIGYGFTQAIEPTLPRPNYDEKHPDLCIRLCRDLIAWDHETGTCKIWTTDLPSESKAQARLEKIKQQLNQAIPAAPALQHDESVEWTTSLKKQDFKLAVTELKEKIRLGDLFQANIATKFSATVNANPVELYRRLRSHNPSPYLALMEFEGTAIVSGSPEQLFAVESGQIRARPIAGTRPRGNDENEDAGYELELMEDRKEQAEHTMLVDLVRNDLAKICTPGTVLVPERGSVERYRRVMHLVSRVEGKLRPGTGFIDWLQALFPGGTITGAPKHRACLRISEAEPVARGFYTGSAGFLSWDHKTSHWNILIRTLQVENGRMSVHAGSGIVIGSEPENEWNEAGHKAQAMLEAATGPTASDGFSKDSGSVSRHGSWQPRTPPGQVSAKVLLVDNYDSFIHNLADYCAALGAEVTVVRCDENLEQRRVSGGFTHVILGPGPGRPDEAGNLLSFTKAVLGKIPVLGICLGHQALAEATGATISVANKPVHGEVELIHHDGRGIHSGISGPFEATRYHSLIVDEMSLPDNWNITARLEDGTVMAMQHKDCPAIGLQYHPESIGTDEGRGILFRFLSTV